MGTEGDMRKLRADPKQELNSLEEEMRK